MTGTTGGEAAAGGLMQVLRMIVVFLVGVGIAIGAHFAGLFERLPNWWFARTGAVATADPNGYGVPPPDAYPPSDGYAGANGYPPPNGYGPSDSYPPPGGYGSPDRYGPAVNPPPDAISTVVPGGADIPAPIPAGGVPVSVPADASGAPISLHLAYRAQEQGGCAPAYAI